MKSLANMKKYKHIFQNRRLLNSSELTNRSTICSNDMVADTVRPAISPISTPVIRIEAISEDDDDDDWQTVKVVPAPQKETIDKSSNKSTRREKEAPPKISAPKPVPLDEKEDWGWSDSDEEVALRPPAASKKSPGASSLSSKSGKEQEKKRKQVSSFSISPLDSISEEEETRKTSRIGSQSLPPPLPSQPKPSLSNKAKPALPSQPKPALSISPIADSSEEDNFNWDSFFGSKSVSPVSPVSSVSSVSSVSTPIEEEKEVSVSPGIMKDDWEHVQPALQLANTTRQQKKEAKAKPVIKDPWEDDSEETPVEATPSSVTKRSTRRQFIDQRISNSLNGKYHNESTPTSSSKISKKSNRKPKEDDWANDSDESPIPRDSLSVKSMKSMKSSNRKPQKDDWGDDSDNSSLPVEVPVSKPSKPLTKRQSLDQRMPSNLSGRYPSESTPTKANRKYKEDDWANDSDESPIPRASLSVKSMKSMKSSTTSNRKPQKDDWGDDSDNSSLPVEVPVSKSTKRQSINQRISNSRSGRNPDESTPKRASRKPQEDDWGDSTPIRSSVRQASSHSIKPFTRKPEPIEWFESDEMPIETLHTPPNQSSNEFDFFSSPPAPSHSHIHRHSSISQSSSSSKHDRVSRTLSSIPNFDYLSQHVCLPPSFSF